MFIRCFESEHDIGYTEEEREVTWMLAGTRAARVMGSALARARAGASERYWEMRVTRYACDTYMRTYRVATIGPRKGNIAAGGRGRHGGGEPLCCVRATKTMRRHEAARDAPRRLCRSSYTQVPRRTHYVHAPSSGDGDLKRRCDEGTEGKKKKLEG